MTMDEGPCKSVARSSKDDIELKDLPVYSLCNMKDENGVACAPKGGVACPFPWRLHECLEAVEKEGLEHIVSWAPHGRAFTVHHPDKFVELVLPRFFDQTKYPSFQRQLNIYGFSRFLQGRDKGAYYHICFVRGHPSLVRDMVRQKVKGNKHAPKTKKKEYDFYHPAWKTHVDGSADSAAALLSLAEKASDEASLPTSESAKENDCNEGNKEKRDSQKTSFRERQSGDASVSRPEATVLRQSAESSSPIPPPAMYPPQVPIVSTAPLTGHLANDRVLTAASGLYNARMHSAALQPQQRVILSGASPQELQNHYLPHGSNERVVVLPSYGQPHSKVPLLANASAFSCAGERHQYRPELITQNQYQAALHEQHLLQEQQRTLLAAALQERLVSSSVPASQLHYPEMTRLQHEQVMAPTLPRGHVPSMQPTGVVNLPPGSASLVNGSVVSSAAQAVAARKNVVGQPTLVHLPATSASAAGYTQSQIQTARPALPMGLPPPSNEPKAPYVTPVESSASVIAQSGHDPLGRVYVLQTVK